MPTHYQQTPAADADAGQVLLYMQLALLGGLNTCTYRAVGTN